MGDSTDMLSTCAPLSVNSAKQLSAQRERPCAALRSSALNAREWGDSGGADVSALD
jgi:hypothetical protein